MGRTYSLTGTATSSLQISSQFMDLVNALSMRGFVLKDTISSEFLVAMNHNPKIYAEFLSQGGDPKKAILVLLEPSAVYPTQYSSKILGSYSLVLAPGNPTFKDPNGEFIPWPYELLPNPLTPTKNHSDLRSQIDTNVRDGLFRLENWSERKHLITLINANKVSPVKNENYSLRRLYAHQIPADSLSVFGDLWNTSLMKKILHRLTIFYFSAKSCYLPAIKSVYGNLHWKYETARGMIDDKQALLRTSKFSIIIENDSSYMSEKLFDALVNGCIPIYFGLNPREALVPENVLIRLPHHPSQLLSQLSQLSDLDIQQYLVSIESFVTSSGFINNWEKSLVFERIATAIADHFGFDNV